MPVDYPGNLALFDGRFSLWRRHLLWRDLPLSLEASSLILIVVCVNDRLESGHGQLGGGVKGEVVQWRVHVDSKTRVLLSGSSSTLGGPRAL